MVLDHDAELYEKRNTVDRLITRPKARRGIGTRYGNAAIVRQVPARGVR
jgi:hypothetical protein